MYWIVRIHPFLCDVGRRGHRESPVVRWAMKKKGPNGCLGYIVYRVWNTIHGYMGIRIIVKHYMWSNYSDLTRPPQMVVKSKGKRSISGKPRLVKYYLIWPDYIDPGSLSKQPGLNGSDGWIPTSWEATGLHAKCRGLVGAAERSSHCSMPKISWLGSLAKALEEKCPLKSLKVKYIWVQINLIWIYCDLIDDLGLSKKIEW